MGYYAIPFALVTVPLVYLVSTRFWSVAHAHGLVTAAEFVRVRFGSRPLALLVAVTAIGATLPYVAMQLIALQAVFKVLGLTGELPLVAAVLLVSVATFRSGLRAPALLSIAKDILLAWLALSIILVVAMSGGWGATFRTAGLHFAAVQSPATGLLLAGPSTITFLSVIVGSALSIFAYPHAVTAILAAKDRNTIKRNAAALPVYTMVLALMALLGLFALARGVLPVDADLSKGIIGDTNTITPMIFHKLFPAWCAGLAYATLAVAALVPTAVMSISVANLFTRSIYVEYLRPRATPTEEARVSRWTSLLVKAGAAGVILLLDPTFSTELQLIGGVFVLQILPATFFGLMSGWFHRWALTLGLLVGLAMSAVMLYETPQLSPTGRMVTAHFGGSSWPLAKWGVHTDTSVYIGLITLVVNTAVVVVGTLVLRLVGAPSNVDVTHAEDYATDADSEGLDRLDQLLDGGPRQTGAHALR
jgi:SSS family solute:Na+ symporter